MRSYRALILSAISVLACSRAEIATNVPTAKRWDSAGIEIVENPATLPRRVSGWRVEEQPELDIGVREGQPEYVLHRVHGAVRVADGRVMVGQGGSELRIYSATGQHDTTLMFQGVGPEELQAVLELLPYRGDSALLRGGGPGTGMNVMIVDSRGRFARKFSIRESMKDPPLPQARSISGRGTGLQGVGGDGSLIVRGSGSLILGGKPGPVWSTARHWRLDPNGQIADTLATLRIDDMEEGQILDEAAPYSIPIFGRGAPVAAIHDRWMFHGDGDQFEILVFDIGVNAAAEPLPKRIIRYDIPNRTAGDSERGSVLRMSLERYKTADDSARMRAFHEKRTARPTFPAFTALRTDADGNLWVELPRLTCLRCGLSAMAFHRKLL